MKPRHAAEVGAVIFACEGIFAVAHRLLHAQYSGFTNAHNVAIDTGLAILWFSSAISMLAHRTTPAFVIAVLGMMGSFVHGIMFSVSSRLGYGTPFIVAAFVLAFMIVHARPAWWEAHETKRRPPTPVLHVPRHA